MIMIGIFKNDVKVNIKGAKADTAEGVAFGAPS